eukprot:COSAG02_NODE_67_length_42609_cov_14.506681_23_plen_141_part_00
MTPQFHGCFKSRVFRSGFFLPFLLFQLTILVRCVGSARKQVCLGLGFGFWLGFRQLLLLRTALQFGGFLTPKKSLSALAALAKVTEQEQQVVNVHYSICADVLVKGSRLAKDSQEREKVTDVDGAVACLNTGQKSKAHER